MNQYFDNKELFLGPKTEQYGSHMVMTNVIKETKTKHLNIDTRLRNDFDNTTNLSYNVSLPERYNEVRNMSVTHLELPITFYNISSDIGNNTFKLSVDGSSLIVIVPDGNYNIATLTTAVNTLLSSTHIIIEMGLFATFKHNEESDTHTNISFDFTSDKNGNTKRFDFKSSLGWLLGFRKTTITFTGTSLTAFMTNGFKSGAFIDLTGIKYIYLVIDEFTTSGNPSSFVSPLPNSLMNKNIIARISMSQHNYPFGSILPANLENGHLLTDIRSYTGKVDIQKMNIQLVDEFGRNVNLNGSDFSFCLSIKHE